MTQNEFKMKLFPFFTVDQILRLEEYAYESAKDAHAGIIDLSDEDLRRLGRWHVCDWLTYADLQEIRSVAGDDITQERIDALYEQMNDEWRSGGCIRKRILSKIFWKFRKWQMLSRNMIR